MQRSSRPWTLRAAADGPGTRLAVCPGDRQAARRGRRVPGIDVLPHVPGDGDHGVPVAWGTLEHTQQIPGHPSPKTTKLYDPPADTVTVHEIEAYPDLHGPALRTTAKTRVGGAGRYGWKLPRPRRGARNASSWKGPTPGLGCAWRITVAPRHGRRWNARSPRPDPSARVWADPVAAPPAEQPTGPAPTEVNFYHDLASGLPRHQPRSTAACNAPRNRRRPLGQRSSKDLPARTYVGPELQDAARSSCSTLVGMALDSHPPTAGPGIRSRLRVPLVAAIVHAVPRRLRGAGLGRPPGRRRRSQAHHSLERDWAGGDGGGVAGPSPQLPNHSRPLYRRTLSHRPKPPQLHATTQSSVAPPPKSHHT